MRERWDLFIAAKAVADASLHYEDGRASALALWEFVAAAGSGEALAALIGTLVPPEDPLAELLWSVAADIRRGGSETLSALALHLERGRLLRGRRDLLGAAAKPGEIA